MRQPVLAAAATAAACCAAAPSHADVLLSDSAFPSANWVLEPTYAGTPGAGSVTATQIAAGGNPGPYRQVDATSGAAAGDALWAFHRFGTTTPTRYDPATQGAIAALDFSIDYRGLAGGTLSSFQRLLFAVKQSNQVFYAGGIDTGQLNTWNHSAMTGLTASAFTPVPGFSGAPDFSASGAPIRFGFITMIETPAGTVFSSRAEYDNWSVRVAQVPAPAGATLAFVSALAAARRRSR